MNRAKHKFSAIANRSSFCVTDVRRVMCFFNTLSVRFEVRTARTREGTILWHVWSFSLLDVRRSFGV
jgi:hypothetical protein